MSDRSEPAISRASQLPSAGKGTAAALGTSSNQTRIPDTLPGDLDSPKPLFIPTQQAIHDSPVHRFARRVNAKFGLSLASYEQLYEWSTIHIDNFWGLVWDETDVIGFKGEHVVDNSALPPDNPSWFKDARMNWAQNMLRSRSATKTAMIEASKFFTRF